MKELVKILFDFNKLPSKLVILIFVLNSALLFAPLKWLEKIHLSKFNESYGHWVGIAFILSFSFLVVVVVTMIFDKINWRKYGKEVKGNIKNEIERLDESEKAIIREFVLQRRSTLSMPIDDPTVVGLLDKRILRFVNNNMGAYIMNGVDMPCTLTKYATELIEADTSLIGLPKKKRELSLQEIEDLQKKRPEWVNHMLS